MVGELLREKQFPWCTLVLVVASITCNICVLVGNYRMAEGIHQMGSSTAGWSGVGLGVARSLRVDLDDRMEQISGILLDSLSHITAVQDSLDVVLSLVGNSTEAVIEASPELSLLQREGHRGLAMLQESGKGDPRKIVQALVPAATSAVHQVLQQVMAKASELLTAFLAKIRPALEQVGLWLTSFGEKIQSGIDTFSKTLDVAQKMFDKIMAQIGSKGKNEAQMLKETFSLFDSGSSGQVSVSELKGVADLYDITTLEGNITDELVAKYDTSGNKELNKEELREFVNDPALPGIMAVMLRTLARRLSEVSGVVSSARGRDEVAAAVVKYMMIVAAKNQTRLLWISDHLGSGKLPLEFSSSIFAQLCLQEEEEDLIDPDVPHVGRKVVTDMYELHPEQTSQALALLSNTTFWFSEGYPVDEQPGCVQRISKWLVSKVQKRQARNGTTATLPEPDAALVNALASSVSIGDVLAQASSRPVDHSLLCAVPAIALRQGQVGVERHYQARMDRERRRWALYNTKTSRVLLEHLLGGATPGGGSGGVIGEQVVLAGQTSPPEVLEFAQRLAANATEASTRYLDMCFVYSSESSSTLDNFATQIQGMVGKVQSFLELMTRYASPTGIQLLEREIQNFAEQGMGDVMSVVERRLLGLINQTAPALEDALVHAAHNAGEQVGQAINDALEHSIGEALKTPLGKVVADFADSPEAGAQIGEMLGEELGKQVANMTAGAVAEKAGDFVEQVVEQVLEHASDILDNALSDKDEDGRTAALLAMAPARSLSLVGMGSLYGAEYEDLPEMLSGSWESMVSTLRSLGNTLPMAAKSLTTARAEVGKLASGLDDVFKIFEAKGPDLFASAAGMWRMIWGVYFVVFLPVSGFLLYYGLWAGGYFGGPKPVEEEEDLMRETPHNWRERCFYAWEACSLCLKNFHDSEMCIWCIIVVMQLLVLVMFAVSAVLCIIAGVKTFIVGSCSSVYVLSDSTICTETLGKLRGLVPSFSIDASSIEPLEKMCTSHSLLTCQILDQKMAGATLLTTIFSFLGTIVSVQMIIDTGILHEQAKYRRYANELLLEEQQGQREAAPA